MKPKEIVVCDKCDENIQLEQYKDSDDICIHCGGKVSDRNGKVMILEIWTKEQAFGNDCKDGQCS